MLSHQIFQRFFGQYAVYRKLILHLSSVQDMIQNWCSIIFVIVVIPLDDVPLDKWFYATHCHLEKEEIIY